MKLFLLFAFAASSAIAFPNINSADVEKITSKDSPIYLERQGNDTAVPQEVLPPVTPSVESNTPSLVPTVVDISTVPPLPPNITSPAPPTNGTAVEEEDDDSDEEDSEEEEADEEEDDDDDEDEEDDNEERKSRQTRFPRQVDENDEEEQYTVSIDKIKALKPITNSSALQNVPARSPTNEDDEAEAQ